MEITYQVIIDYLTKKEPKKDIDNNNNNNNNNNNINNKHIFTHSKNFPDIFYSILGDNFYKYGITTSHNNTNISFWSSLLTLLDKDFMKPIDNEEINIINNIKNQFIEKYNSSIKTIDKNDIKERFKLEPDYYVLQYVVDILDINFIILDFDNNDFKVLYKSDELNMWKQSMLFAKNNNFWEPIMRNKNNENERFFDVNDNSIKKIFQLKDLKYYEDKKEIKINTNILDVIISEKNKLAKKPQIMIDTSKKSDYTDLNKTKLSKMKIADLLVITDKMGIQLSKKPKKNDIVTSILAKIKILNNI